MNDQDNIIECENTATLSEETASNEQTEATPDQSEDRVEEAKSVQEYVDEIARLSSLIAERERRDAEALMFSELFPDVDLDTIPDAVKNDAEERGIPLVASYAIYERKRYLAEAAAKLHNLENVGRSSGPLDNSDNFGEALSMEQIRAMSPAQVRRHYKQIIKVLSNN